MSPLPVAERPPVLVGNDVVDLLDPRTQGKAFHARFVDRVFAPAERSAIRAGGDHADRELWIRWAAKEAAYKVVSKLLGSPPIFEHARFRVMDLTRAGSDSSGWVDSGTVAYRELPIPVLVVSDPHVLHAVAHAQTRPGATATLAIQTGLELLDAPESAWNHPLHVLLTQLGPEEAEPVHSRASAAVRVAARAHLARALGVDRAHLAIVSDPGRPGRRPPRVLVDGAAGRADVSLSHDGRWIAWALHAGGGADHR